MPTQRSRHGSVWNPPPPTSGMAGYAIGGFHHDGGSSSMRAAHEARMAQLWFTGLPEDVRNAIQEATNSGNWAEFSISEQARILIEKHGSTFESRAQALGLWGEMLGVNNGGAFFSAASVAARAFIALDDPRVFLTGLDAETVGFLNALSLQIFSQAAEMFVRLSAGQELPFAPGLSGGDLALVMLAFEQGVVSQGFLNSYAPRGSSQRALLVQDINDLSSGWFDETVVRSLVYPDSLDRAFDNFNGTFDFQNPEHRIRIGVDVIEQVLGE